MRLSVGFECWVSLGFEPEHWAASSGAEEAEDSEDAVGW